MIWGLRYMYDGGPREAREPASPRGDIGLGTHLRLLLREARLGCDEAQRGGVRVLVDLVEVVLQDLHLVLRGAARGLRRHGPCESAGEPDAPGERGPPAPSRRPTEAPRAAGSGVWGSPPSPAPSPT